MKTKNKKKDALVGIVILIVLVGMLGVGSFASLFGGGGAGSTANVSDTASQAQTSVSTRDLALGCTTDALTTFHIHPHLEIIINGQQQTIPADIGISAACMHPLHTHDNSGTIHVESPERRDFTLADFFAVWGKTFNKDQVLGSAVDKDHEIVMTANSQPSDAFENLVLTDSEQIVIEYKHK